MSRFLIVILFLSSSLASFPQEKGKKKDLEKGASAATKKIKEEQQRSTFQIGSTKVEQLNDTDSAKLKVQNKHPLKPKISTRFPIKKSGK